MGREERYSRILDWFEINQPMPATELHYDSPFHLLIAVILSAQCTDKRVNAVVPPLFERFPKPEDLASATFEEVYPFIGEEDMDSVTLRRAAHTVPDRGEYGIAETGVYTFPEENQLGLKSLRLQGNCLYYENAVGKVSLSFGRGGNLETTWPGWPEVPALSCGGWVEPDLLRVRCYAVGNAPCGFDMLLRFRQDCVTVQCRKSNDPVTMGYDGVATGYTAV